jgi:hypothetical protein
MPSFSPIAPSALIAVRWPSCSHSMRSWSPRFLGVVGRQNRAGLRRWWDAWFAECSVEPFVDFAVKPTDDVEIARIPFALSGAGVVLMSDDAVAAVAETLENRAGGRRA